MESTPPTRLWTRREFLRTSTLTAAALASSTGARAAGADEIVSMAIHPAIGIARVGNSRESFFFGPEIPGALPRPPRGGFKDRFGAIAKQAARFRIYGLDARGNAVREITAQDADITWQINVANTKAAWYEFYRAFDLPIAKPVPRRNANIADRSTLAIKAVPRKVRGASAGPTPLNGGRFFGQAVELGEILTDERGRLVFLPGSGAAYSAPGAPPLGGFADNDGWTDNLCDGPVQATIIFNGRKFVPDPAWVVSAIPNYAPGVACGLVTLYDTIYSMEIDLGRLKHGPVNFQRDVMPVFDRLVDMQWVNAGFYASNGFGTRGDWTRNKLRRQLARKPGSRAYRTSIFRRFRDPNSDEVRPNLVPQLYGDGTLMPPNDTIPTQWLSVTPHQFRMLGRWARGHFDNSTERVPQSLASVPIAEQPATLDRAALDGCLGGAFHPGIEFPWIARVKSVWTKPFRLKLRSLEPDLRNWGPELTTEIVFQRNGPLDGCTPGDVTKWLGIPWHADGASCRSGYQKRISPVLPAFWPARVPNQVLSEADYWIVMDRSLPLAERRAAFARRRDWERFIARPVRPPTLALMATEWFKQGLVTVRPGPGDGNFPEMLKVETGVGYSVEPAVSYPASDWVPQG